jgi:hypothetical protein
MGTTPLLGYGPWWINKTGETPTLFTIRPWPTCHAFGHRRRREMKAETRLGARDAELRRRGQQRIDAVVGGDAPARRVGTLLITPLRDGRGVIVAVGRALSVGGFGGGTKAPVCRSTTGPSAVPSGALVQTAPVQMVTSPDELTLVLHEPTSTAADWPMR